MISCIEVDGVLNLSAEDPTEAFALKMWLNNFTSSRKKGSLINVETDLKKLAEKQIEMQLEMNATAGKIQADMQGGKEEEEEQQTMMGFKYHGTD